MTEIENNQEPEALTRRNFLKMGIGALGALAALEVGTAGFLFLRSRSLEGKSGGVVTAGEEADFVPGSVTEFPDASFFLVRAFDQGFLAVFNRCPHLGCAVHWAPDKNRFVCPCHASSFDLYGDFDSPPVPRPLDLFPIEVKEGKVLVDTAMPVRREQFLAEQLVYA